MVMDDAPTFVESQAFAEAVAAEIAARGISIETSEAQTAVSADRYSRVLTVRSTHEDAAMASAIADAAAAVLPDQINRYLVADQAAPAMVHVIDPPGDASRSQPHQELKIAVLTVVAAAAGVGLALVAHAWTLDLRVLEPERASDSPR
jgi:capsular polysaccharide biosynthesis protein